ncbi:unnamed protein product [Polarella glacialis]|uniref:Uncharacterized protein n=1 Tax=Polarella glacialis TaxID=89957 RepID=A0A813L776_POLGL|nr:unnamed protein product [Polarella glacialis]
MDAAYSHSPILSGRDYSIALSVASEVVDEDVAAEAVKRSLHAVYDCGAVSPPETSVALSVASEVADEDAAAEVVTRCLYEFASPAAIMQEASVHRSIASDVIDEDAASEAVNRSWAGAHDYANAAVSDAAHAARNSSAREPLTPTSVAGESVVTAGASVLIEDMANDMINYAVLRSNLPDADSVVESEARTDQEQAIQQALAEEEARIRAIVDAEIKRLSAEQAELAQQRAAAAANEAIRLATLEAEQLKQLEKEAVLREQQASGALQKVAAQELTLRKAAEKEAEHRAAEEEARSKKAAEKEEERKNAEEKSRLRALAQEEARLQRESGARQTDEQAREEEEQRVKQELARKEAQLRLAAEEEAKQRAEEEERRHLEALELSAVKQSEAEAKARQLVLKEEERVKSERETDSARLRAAQESAAKAQELAEEKAKQAEEKSQEADTARKAASEAASRSPSDDNDILGRLVKSCVNSATSSSVEAKNVPLEGGDTTQTFPRSDDPSLFDLTATATQFPRAAAGAEVTLQFQSTTAGLWASGLAMSSTAPPRIGMGSRQGPEVPSLWEPHSRSDGFNACGWRASPSEVSDSLPASEYTTPRDEEDVVPTFAPKFFADTIPVSQRHDPVDPEAPTLKAPFSHRSAEMEYDNERVPIFVPSSARAGLKQKEHGFSRPVPARSEHLARDAAAASKDQLVDPNIISQLCALLNPPDTPPSEYERIRRGPASTWARSPELSARSLSQRSARSLSQRSAQAIAAPPLPVARKLLSARSDEAMKQVAPAAECGPLKALLHSQRSELQFSPARESGRSVGSQARRVPAKSEASSNAWSAPLGSEATPTPKSLRRKEGMVEFQEFERYLLAEHPQAEGLPSLPLLGIPGEAAGSAPQTPEQKGGLQEALSRLTQARAAAPLYGPERSRRFVDLEVVLFDGTQMASYVIKKRQMGAAPTAEDEAATVFKAGAPQHQALRQELEGSLDQQLRRPTEAAWSAMAGRIALSKRMDMAQEQQVRLMLQDIANSMFGEAESQQSSARRLPQLPGGSFFSGSRAANSVIGSPSIYTARSSVRSKGSSMSQDMDPIDAAEALELEVAGLMSELCGRVYAPTYDSSSEA